MNKAQEYVNFLTENVDDADQWDDYINYSEWEPEHEEQLYKGRWSTRTLTVLRMTDNSLLGVEWDNPATEMQEGQGYSYDFYEVQPYEITITKYRKK